MILKAFNFQEFVWLKLIEKKDGWHLTKFSYFALCKSYFYESNDTSDYLSLSHTHTYINAYTRARTHTHTRESELVHIFWPIVEYLTKNAIERKKKSKREKWRAKQFIQCFFEQLKKQTKWKYQKENMHGIYFKRCVNLILIAKEKILFWSGNIFSPNCWEKFDFNLILVTLKTFYKRYNKYWRWILNWKITFVINT